MDFLFREKEKEGDNIKLIKKGIILAGGSGSRLYPVTKVVCKQLLPILERPLIYFPLSILLMSNVEEVLIITSPDDINKFKHCLGDGTNLGIHISYAVQNKPSGIAESFIIGEEFIGNDPVCLILGDNIIHGHTLPNILEEITNKDFSSSATIVGTYVKDPSRYGIAEIKDGKIISLEEKPKEPKSNFAVIGLYFYPSNVVEVAKEIQPSNRGELEITDVNKWYLDRNELDIKILGRGFTFFDVGVPSSFLEASNFVHIIEERQGLKIGCVEELAFKKGLIDKKKLIDIATSMNSSDYGRYLLSVIENEGAL